MWVGFRTWWDSSVPRKHSNKERVEAQCTMAFHFPFYFLIWNLLNLFKTMHARVFFDSFILHHLQYFSSKKKTLITINAVVGIYWSSETINGGGGFQESVFSEGRSSNSTTGSGFARKLLAMGGRQLKPFIVISFLFWKFCI